MLNVATPTCRAISVIAHAGPDAADLYLKKLSALPVTKGWNKEMESFGIGASLEEAIPDKKTLETFETAILDFVKEI